MATLREMIDVPDQIMGMQSAVGITVHAGGPGSGRHKESYNVAGSDCLSGNVIGDGVTSIPFFKRNI
jgi:hypothetical protein